MKRVAIIGSGPAALMAASVISQGGHQVHLYEKRKGIGRKLLIAGSSGLNITHQLPINEFIQTYSGADSSFWSRIIEEFSPQSWIKFIEGLGLETFLGTSRRYFIREMKAAKLLQLWAHQLKKAGVQFHFEHELTHFQAKPSSVELTFNCSTLIQVDAACFCLGGGSYEPEEDPLRWPKIFQDKGVQFYPFQASNVGYQIHWKEAFLKESNRTPLKNIKLSTSKGAMKGELLITEYGLEGTPIYFLGTSGRAYLDLKPDLTEQEILKKLKQTRENLLPLRVAKKHLSLSPSALALLYHHGSPQALREVSSFVQELKAFPLNLVNSQPLSEAISSSGGISFNEVNSDLMLHHHTGCFLAGEMLNWDAPTGGFLIQACVSQGHWVGQSILRYLQTLI
ncbi:TIGR03862 family flavoprotein [bacterium]|nr:TIGR03862 family flavoprotein [bacterium]